VSLSVKVSNVRVLIVGAGDLGQRLALQLKLHDIPTLTARRTPGLADLVLDLCQPISKLSSPEQGFADFSTLTHVVFCATPDARNAESYQALYVDGMRNVQAACPSARIVFCSSTAVYAQNDGGWVDETSACQPTEFNGIKLLAAEALLDAQQDLILRLGGIYGESRQHARRQALAGAIGAMQWTNRIHIDDAAQIIARLIVDARTGVFNVVDDLPVLQRVLYEHLRGETSVSMDRDQLQTIGKRVSNDKLRQLGYPLVYPSFREGYAKP
jgi:nucleoside-diphosphate-sugar epimerase